jgi:hypothetical protein
MRSHSRIPHESRPDAIRVEVTRIKSEMTLTVRTLSYALKGLFTHFKGQRSHYCAEGDCDRGLHAINRQWKGYVAAEIWFQSSARWVPTVLEVTEHCELDMRDLYARGQVWELSRAKESTKKKMPVIARLLEQREEKTFPAPFDIMPVLRTLYHRLDIELSQENPMPGRVVLLPSQGEPPPMKLHAGVQEKIAPEDKEKVRQMLDQFRRDRNGALPVN